MNQILKKPYDCMSCRQQIRIAKIDNPGPDAKKKWDKFEMDGVTPHVCRKAEQNQQEQDASRSSNSSQEIAAIKAQLLLVVSRLDRIEQQNVEGQEIW